MPGATVPVYLESGRQRVFAGALEWPGWSRSGKDEKLALEALGSYAGRYAEVAQAAGLTLPAVAGLQVVERLAGSATTDFGAPGAIPAHDTAPLSGPEARRLASLVEAAWRTFDRVEAHAPAELRKGPRGGGRDRDAVAAHVVSAESAYARKLGIRLPPPDPADRPAVAGLRAAVLEALGSGAGAPPAGRGWPPRYAARRIAWHVLDHAWEIEDRSHG